MDSTAASLAEATDADLLARHVAGDADAFGELFRRHRDRMWAVAMRTIGNSEMAADAVQEAFIAAFRRADRFRGDAAVTTWLHRITVNCSIDRLRREKPTSPLPEIDLADRHDRYGQTETALDVRAALATLPDAQRMALILVDMDGMSVAQAATVLQVAEGTIKSRCARGRAALAPLLRHREPPEPSEPSRERSSQPSVEHSSQPSREASRGRPNDARHEPAREPRGP